MTAINPPALEAAKEFSEVLPPLRCDELVLVRSTEVPVDVHSLRLVGAALLAADQALRGTASLQKAVGETIQAATYPNGECAGCGRPAEGCGATEADSCAIGWLRRAMKEYP